jgi:protein-disulfide isomerase
MNHRNRTVRILTAALVVGALALGLTVLAETDNTEARRAKIVENLKLQFPQIADRGLAVNEVKASGFEGLDEGNFSFQGQQGQQTQRFFVSTDDKQLFMISGNPIDVSRSTEEVQAELAKRAEEAAKLAAEKAKELQDAVAGAPTKGNPEAPVTIVEFSDFQCPYCSRGTNTMNEILAKYKDDVKIVFKHFPLGFHPWAKPAAIAANCAANQKPEAFWTLHDGYFADQQGFNPGNVIEKSKELLADSGLDLEKWSDCASNPESEAYKAESAAVDADMAFGQKVGVSGTPGFFVNGEFINGAQPLAAFEPLIEAAKKGS